MLTKSLHPQEFPDMKTVLNLDEMGLLIGWCVPLE
jgi:hypothetical protein